MARPAPSGTRVTLLCQLRADPGNQRLWADFVDQYGPKIFEWSRKWKVQEADAQDITQVVLLKLVDKMRTFEYDPKRSFRAWLKTLTHHALTDLHRSRQRKGAGQAAGGDAIDVLDNLAARDDLAKILEDEFDRELLEEAMARVRARVAPHTWQAFRLTAIEGLSGAEAAERIPMQVAQVYVCKRRVQQMLREEVAQLEGDAGQPNEKMANHGKAEESKEE